MGWAISDDRYQRIGNSSPHWNAVIARLRFTDSGDRGWSCDDRSVEVIGSIGDGISLTCGGERGDRSDVGKDGKSDRPFRLIPDFEILRRLAKFLFMEYTGFVSIFTKI